MAPASNKWTANAERDLAMAIILSHGAIKHDWNAVAEKMTSWGYGFTTGSMSQHWTKRILKDFKARRAEANAGSEEPETPQKPKAAGKTKTPSSGKRKAKKEDDDDDEETPSKKRVVKDESL